MAQPIGDSGAQIGNVKNEQWLDAPACSPSWPETSITFNNTLVTFGGTTLTFGA